MRPSLENGQIFASTLLQREESSGMYIGNSILFPSRIVSKPAKYKKLRRSWGESQFCSTEGERSLSADARRMIEAPAARTCIAQVRKISLYSFVQVHDE